MSALLVALTMWQALTCLEYSWKAGERFPSQRDVSEEIAWTHCVHYINVKGEIEYPRLIEGENY